MSAYGVIKKKCNSESPQVYTHTSGYTHAGAQGRFCVFKTELFVTDLKFCHGSSSLKNNWSCFSFASHYTKTFFFFLNTRLCCLSLPKRQFQDGLTQGSERMLPKMHYVATEHAHRVATSTWLALPQMDRSLSSCGCQGDVI